MVHVGLFPRFALVVRVVFLLLQAETARVLAFFLIFTFASTSETILCGLYPVTELRMLQESKVGWDYFVIDFVDYGDWVLFVVRERSYLAPLAV